MPSTFNASANAITVGNGTQTIFDTGYRMPHILSSVSGTLNSTNATINFNGAGTGQQTMYPTLSKFTHPYVSAWLQATGVWWTNPWSNNSLDYTFDVQFPGNGNYNIRAQSYGLVQIYIDGVMVYNSTNYWTNPPAAVIKYYNQGNHTVRVVAQNYYPEDYHGVVGVVIREVSTDALVFASVEPTNPGTFVNTTTDNVVATGSYYQFSNSFVWAWMKISTNATRTDVAIGDPIFLTGSILLRFYIDDNSVRGSYILTPMIYNGSIGFREEWQYANEFMTGGVPSKLYPIDVSNTIGNLGLTYTYTLYYGRFI